MSARPGTLRHFEIRSVSGPRIIVRAQVVQVAWSDIMGKWSPVDGPWSARTGSTDFYVRMEKTA